MRLSKFIVLISALVLWVAGMGPVWAAQTLTQDDLAMHKELLQTKLDANKELLQKDLEARGHRIDALEKRLDDQVSRVSDVGGSIDRFGVIAGGLGLLITVALAAAGLVGYFSVSGKARQEAQDAAKEWFESNSNKLTKEINDLKVKAAQSHVEIDAHTQSVAKKRDAAEAQMLVYQSEIGNAHSQDDALKNEGSDAVMSLAEDLKQRPESSYSFEDWNTRAFAAYGSKNHEDAAYYWGRAAAVPNAGAVNAAQSMFNKAITLGELKRDEEAIAAYDAVIAKYDADPAPALRELVARAKNSKGFTVLCQAKEQSIDLGARQSLLIQARQLCEYALLVLSSNAVVLGNLAYAAWLQGDAVVVESKFVAALAAPDGGQAIYDLTLGDLDICPLPEDEGFKTLIDRCLAQFVAGSRSAGAT